MPLYFMCSIRLTPQDQDWLDEYCSRTGQTRSAVIRQGLAVMQDRDHLAQRKIAREQRQKDHEHAEVSQYA
jgi:Arc/MetJ-type ribon-helix-helix transcriptional regulator